MHKAVRVSLICNIVLVSIKATALIVVNSLAIAVDLGISFVGLMVSLILAYSVKLSSKPADGMHNYGYGKIEHVCEAMEGIVLIGIALAMSSQAIAGLIHPAHIAQPIVGFSTSIINAIINFGGAMYIMKMAKKSGSPAIHAEGVHYRLEGCISGIIGISFILTMLMGAYGLGEQALYVDPLAALLVSLVVIVPSVRLAKSSFFKLLDASMGEDSQIEVLKQLNAYISSYCEFKDLKTRTAGREKFIEFKLVIPQDVSLKDGYDMVTYLENDIRSAITNSDVVIKMEPCERDCMFAEKGENCPYMKNTETISDEETSNE